MLDRATDREMRLDEIRDGAATRQALGQAATHRRLPDGQHEVSVPDPRTRFWIVGTAETLDAAIGQVRHRLFHFHEGDMPPVEIVATAERKALIDAARAARRAEESWAEFEQQHGAKIEAIWEADPGDDLLGFLRRVVAGTVGETKADQGTD